LLDRGLRPGHDFDVDQPGPDEGQYAFERPGPRFVVPLFDDALVGPRDLLLRSGTAALLQDLERGVADPDEMVTTLKVGPKWPHGEPGKERRDDEPVSQAGRAWYSIPVFTLISVVDPCVGTLNGGLPPAAASSSPSPGLVTCAKIHIFWNSAAFTAPGWGIRHVIECDNVYPRSAGSLTRVETRSCSEPVRVGSLPRVTDAP
jgi:hypothetical protein